MAASLLAFSKCSTVPEALEMACLKLGLAWEKSNRKYGEKSSDLGRFQNKIKNWEKKAQDEPQSLELMEEVDLDLYEAFMKLSEAYNYEQRMEDIDEIVQQMKKTS